MAFLRIQLISVASAAAAVVIWSSLATLSVWTREVPALQLTGLALTIGGALSLPWWRSWQIGFRPIALGCYGLLVYHVLFILALRLAPPVQANLVHYLWPTLIVLLAPLVVRGVSLRITHVAAACLGLLGAGIAIAGGSSATAVWHDGYALAFAAALVWSTYSLSLRRVQSINAPTTGLCCLISGCVALALHGLGGEGWAELSTGQWCSVVALGLGPMGAAFYLWSHALKEGDPRSIGVLANATPVLSTIFLTLSLGHSFAPFLALSLLLIVAGCAVAAKRT